MEENAIITNIATIIAKDILVDERNNLLTQRPQHFMYASDENVACPLLAGDNDEDEIFFLRQQGLLQDGATHELKPTAQTTPKAEQQTANPAVATDGETWKRVATSKTPAPPAKKKKLELNLLNEFEAVKFEGFLHMSKLTFLKIFQAMRHLLLQDEFPANVPPQAAFSLALWKLTTDEHFEQIALRFHIQLSDCHLTIRHFWHQISDNYESFIRWPSSPQLQKFTLQHFQTHPQLKNFRQLFGIVATKRLDIFFEQENEEICVILQIICDADLKVIDCFVELASNYSFDTSPIGQTLALNSQTMPQHAYLIGNGSLPLKRYLIRPFGGEVGAEQHTREAMFNELLHPAFVIAQDVLDTMAKRFNTLYALEARDLNEVRKIVETVCALHNLCASVEDDYVERKRQTVQFNWAQATEDVGAGKDIEQDEQGILRRQQVMDEIMK